MTAGIQYRRSPFGPELTKILEIQLKRGRNLSLRLNEVVVVKLFVSALRHVG